ncbi:MAG: hypothetical protein HQK58_05930 [Deltaproteobacteria bacterium]|nr:hypothetical protein [Deltaproteobacteria bacterium]
MTKQSAENAAEAAKNTAALIENTRKKVTTGTELVSKTKEDFQNVATTEESLLSATSRHPQTAPSPAG